MIIPLNQNLLIERDEKQTAFTKRKSGILAPNADGQVENEGLVFGTVLYAPKDQNLLIDKSRPINEVEIVAGDRVWYSKYSTGIIMDDRDDKEEDTLDLVPLEDIRAVLR